jgi:soluble lytic murein transglycosylase
MLQRIIRVFFFTIPLAAFLGLACHSDEQGMLRFYYTSNADYQYLEDVESFGQGTIPKTHVVWNVKQVARVLRTKLDPVRWNEKQIRVLAKDVMQLSHQYNFSPGLILSMIEVESRFEPGAVSGRGAIGLMQVMPATGEKLAAQMAMPWDGEKSLRDPLKNMELGLRYMVQLQARFKKLRLSLTAYNIGPAAMLRKLRSGEHLSDSYYNKVMQSYKSYKEYASTAL